MFVCPNQLQRLLCCWLVALVVGCSPKPDSPSAPANNSNEQVNLGMELSSWGANKRKLATEQFLAINWQEPNATKGLPGGELSETEFMALAPDDQSRIQAKVWPALKEIGRQAIVQGKEAERQGKQKKARMCYEAVAQLGDHLSSPNNCLLFQQFGEAIRSLMPGVSVQ